MVNDHPMKRILHRMGQKKNKEFKELKEFKKNVPIKINEIITKTTGDIFDHLGTEPYKKVLSTQEVQAILIKIENLLIEELK